MVSQKTNIKIGIHITHRGHTKSSFTKEEFENSKMYSGKKYLDDSMLRGCRDKDKSEIWGKAKTVVGFPFVGFRKIEVLNSLLKKCLSQPQSVHMYDEHQTNATHLSFYFHFNQKANLFVQSKKGWIVSLLSSHLKKRKKISLNFNTPYHHLTLVHIL